MREEHLLGLAVHDEIVDVFRLRCFLAFEFGNALLSQLSPSLNTEPFIMVSWPCYTTL